MKIRIARKILKDHFRYQLRNRNLFNKALRRLKLTKSYQENFLKLVDAIERDFWTHGTDLDYWTGKSDTPPVHLPN